MHVFHYVIEYRGCHRKGISIYSATEVNLDGFYCGFIDQKCISETVVLVMCNPSMTEL